MLSGGLPPPSPLRSCRGGLWRAAQEVGDGTGVVLFGRSESVIDHQSYRGRHLVPGARGLLGRRKDLVVKRAVIECVFLSRIGPQCCDSFMMPTRRARASPSATP